MNENEPVVFKIVNEDDAVIDNTLASEHPVLKQYKDRIEALENTIATLNVTAEGLRKDRNDHLNKAYEYRDRVKAVLVEAIEDYDQETIKWIASNLDIELTVQKTYEVNVTFTVEVDHEIGEEPDPDWDFSFSVDHNTIQDFSTDIIWSKEIS